MIAAAPFRDRVVHHAVMNVMEPALDRRFIFDCYACRRGKGVHAAVARYQVWATRYRYALKMDIRQYFPSVDHAMLKDMLAERIKDQRALALLGAIIDTSPEVPGEPVWFPGDDLFTPVERRHGIPIGNLTSQFFANLYLDDLDHHLKKALRLPAYLRYVDDLVVLGDDKAFLSEIRHRVAEHLSRLRLVLHPRKAHIMPTRGGLDLLGYRVFPDRRLLRNDNGHRFARRLRAFAEGYAAGRLAWQDFDPSVQSWLGHARHSDTLGLRRAIFAATIFRRGAGRTTAPA